MESLGSSPKRTMSVMSRTKALQSEVSALQIEVNALHLCLQRLGVNSRGTKDIYGNAHKSDAPDMYARHKNIYVFT